MDIRKVQLGEFEVSIRAETPRVISRRYTYKQYLYNAFPVYADVKDYTPQFQFTEGSISVGGDTDKYELWQQVKDFTNVLARSFGEKAPMYFSRVPHEELSAKAVVQAFNNYLDDEEGKVWAPLIQAMYEMDAPATPPAEQPPIPDVGQPQDPNS